MIKILKTNYGLIIVFLFSLLTTGYAIHINHRYYKLYGPFYDSLSYHNEVARIVEIMHQEKIAGGIIAASHNVNGFIPIVSTAFISFYFGLDRAFGCISNGILLLLSSVAIYYYLCQVRKYPTSLSAGIAIFLNSIKII